MPKFSIVIPVYNVEDYIKECLDSIMNQTFKDYEVIVVNDGTKDNSMDIVKKYKVKTINQENGGLSAARNNGAKHAKGEYLLFIDSDDTIEPDLLKELNEATSDKPDLIRFQIQEYYEDKSKKEFKETGFNTCKGEKAFSKICKYHFVENAWSYCIKRSYYEKEKYEFAKGMIHEDFGLMPLVIMKASRAKSIEYIGYNYRQRQNSIMSTVNYEKTKKKVNDFLEHYRFLTREIDKTKLDSKIFKSFIANSLILKITELKGKDYREYKKILKKEKVFDQILTDSFGRKIKKTLLKISPKMYYRHK
ncbi:MAG: glycosyltransferase [Bacilli bacterium]|nr:glycosyltransferase [Bacilli bacterium]